MYKITTKIKLRLLNDWNIEIHGIYNNNVALRQSLFPCYTKERKKTYFIRGYFFIIKNGQNACDQKPSQANLTQISWV